MPNDTVRCDVRETGQNLSRGLDQGGILGIRIGQVVGSFQFDPDREIVASFSPLEGGVAGVPGPQVERHVLDQLAIPANQQMAGNPELMNLLKIRM